MIPEEKQWFKLLGAVSLLALAAVLIYVTCYLGIEWVKK
jgi:hypothetical protein